MFHTDAQWFEQWNTLEPSLVLMYEKLVDLGWVCYNGEIHVIEPETSQSEYHENWPEQESVSFIAFQEASLSGQNNNPANPQYLSVRPEFHRRKSYEQS